MPDQNSIYNFMKSNNLTDLDEKTFINKYSAPDKAKEIYSFMSSNKLTDLDESNFYDKYLKKKVGGAESSLTGLQSKGFSPEQINLLETGAKPPKPSGKAGEIIIPTNITPDQKAYERELKRQDAAINTLKNTYKQKGLNFNEKSKRGQEQIQQLLDKEINNDLTVVTGKDQKPYLVRGEGFLESAGKGILKSITEPIESTKINFTNDPNELADLLDEKIKEEPNVPESAPTKFGGYLGGLAGGLPKMMALLAIPVAGESAMVGEMYHNALANQRRALYEKGLQEGMDRPTAAMNAMKNAPITAIPDAIVGAVMARGIGGKAAGAEIIPNAAKESFLKATGNGLKGVAKVSGIGGAAEYGRSKAEQQLGYNVTDAEAIENGLRGMGEYAIMDAAFKLAHAGPKYLSSAAKNLLSTVPKEVLEVAAEKYPDGKQTLEDVAKFSETKTKVQDFVPEEKVGAVTGLTEKVQNLENNIKELEEKKKTSSQALHPFMDGWIKEYQDEIDFYKKQVDKVVKSKDPTGVTEEIDDITGLKAGQEPSIVEEKVEDITQFPETLKAKEVKPTEKEVFSETDKKGRTSTYFSNTTENNGLVKTNFTFSRTDKSPTERFNATQGVPTEQALGNKYEVNKDDIPENSQVVNVSEIRVDKETGNAAATVTFESNGETFKGEVRLTKKAEVKPTEVKEGGLTNEIKNLLNTKDITELGITEQEKDILNNISSSENISLNDFVKTFSGYKVNDYIKYNNLLRKEIPITKENLIKEGENKEIAEILEDKYNDISRILSNSTFSPEKQTSLYRVMYSNESGLLNNYNVGDIISDKGFSSTTIDKNWVKDVKKPMIIYELDKGDKLNGFYAAGVEKEFIINKGTDFVVKKKEVIDGNTVLTVGLPKNKTEVKPTEEKYFNERHRTENFDDNAKVVTYLSQDRGWDSSMKDYVGEKNIFYTLPNDGKIMFKEIQNNTNTFKVSAEAINDKPSDIKNAFKRIEKYLPLNHKLAEKVSISVDGLRIWNNFIKTGKYIKTGETNEVELTPIDKTNLFKDLKYTTETKWSGAEFQNKNENEAIERVKKYIKDNNLYFKVKLDGNKIKVEVPVLEYNTKEKVKSTEQQLKTKENAIQEPSASRVLQPTQERVGETRGERKRVEPSIKGEKVTEKGKQAPINEKEQVTKLTKTTTPEIKPIAEFKVGDKVIFATDKSGDPFTIVSNKNGKVEVKRKDTGVISVDEIQKLGNDLVILKSDWDKGIRPTKFEFEGDRFKKEIYKKTYQQALKEKQEAEKKQTRQFAAEKASVSRRIFDRVFKMDAPEDAEQVALRYLADGGKISKEAIDEAYGSVKRAQLNVKRRELLSEEVKSKDFVGGNETIDEVAHRLWEENGQRISERDIKEALMAEIGNNNTRLEAAEAYLDKYSPEYQLEKEEMRLAEQYKEQYLEEQAKLEEELRKPLDEQIEGEASEEHINNLIEQYEAEIKGEDQQLRSESEGKISAEASKGEAVKEAPKGEERLAKEYKEVVKKAGKKAKENAKKDFVDRNFDSIVEKLKIQIKCPT